MTLEQYLAQDMFIPYEEINDANIMAKKEQHLKDQLKRQDLDPFFERTGLKPFNRQAKVFKIQDVRDNLTEYP